MYAGCESVGGLKAFVDFREDGSGGNTLGIPGANATTV
jgi:hypothetical protein